MDKREHLKSEKGMLSYNNVLSLFGFKKNQIFVYSWRNASISSQLTMHCYYITFRISIAEIVRKMHPKNPNSNLLLNNKNIPLDLIQKNVMLFFIPVCRYF